MSSVIQDQSTKIAVRTRSTFDLSRDVLNTTDFGKILPIFCEDMIPTDNFDINVDNFIRLAPMVLPTYGRIRVFMNFFFVPNRLLIKNWEEMIQGGASGTYPENFPYFDPRAVAQDYLRSGGVPDPESVPDPTDPDDMKIWRRLRDMAQFMQSFYGSRLVKTLPILPDGALSWEEYIDDYFFTNSSGSYDLPTPEPIQAYNRIWVEYFSAIDLSESDTLEQFYSPKVQGEFRFDAMLDEGTIPLDFFNMKQACYKKDLFTTAFYRPQRGGMTLVPVDLFNGSHVHFGVHGNNLLNDTTITGNTTPPYYGTLGVSGTAPGNLDIQSINMKNIDVGAFSFDWHATLSQQTGQSSVLGEFSTYTQRYADAIQRVKERNNIAGARYFDVILARFGIKLEAVRLDRAEYIGSDSFVIQIGDITSTSDTEAQGGSYLGQQAGKAIGNGRLHVNYTAKDYGWIIGLMHILPDTQGSIQGLEKKFTRRSREDYFTPELEDTGMQPIHNQEIFLSWSDSDANNGVFGYAPRYNEYKYGNDIVAGDYCIKDNNAVYGDGDAWHLHRIFEDLPTLSTEFVTVGVNADGLDRIFQQATDGSQDHFYPWIHIGVKANRPMMGFADSALSFANESGSGKINLPYSGTRL